MEEGEEEGEGEGEAGVGEEIQGEDGMLEGSMVDGIVEEGETVSILDKELVGEESVPFVPEAPKNDGFPWPTGVKRPRGRPRKDGLPPIPRKKRGRKRKRRGYDDDYDFPLRPGGKPGPVAGPPQPECEPTEPHPEKFPFTCEQCRNSFSTETWYDLHSEQHGNPQLQYLICNVCDEAFRFLMTYTNHMNEKHPGMSKREQTMSEKFRCDACKRAFRSPIHLERHIRKANNAEPPPKGPVQVKCKFCEKTFTMEQGLENHTVRAHPEHKRFQCTADDCIETFISKEERASHLANFHGLDPMHIYKCPVAGCNKAYTSVSSLNYHYALRHTLEKPFACEICGKTWVKIGRLREHMKTHSTEKNELCDECGRAFKTRPELKDHKMEAHTDSGKEKLQCRFCTATFSRRSSRSYHERKHRNEAPYICPKPGCSKRFVAVIDYKRHLIYHTGAKLYRCRYCGNCFTRSDYLKGHEKRHILRGEQIDVAPPIEETVTIKVPWPMEKAVKIQGQNVVVSIEPDPSLAEGDMTAEALIALDHLQNVPVEMADGSRQGDIVHQAAAQAMTGELQGTQLLQFADGTTFATNSASAAIQEAVAQAQAQVASTEGGGEEVSSEALPEATQILLQAAAEQAEALIQGGMDNTHITLEGATSEQAAMVLQQLAAENAQVILHPSGEDGMSTMQATLQNENGETSIVVVNLATQPDGTVTAITEGGQQISLQTTTECNEDDGQTSFTTADGNMIITTSEALMNSQGEQITVTTVAGDDGVGENTQTVSMVLPEGMADGGKGMIMVVQEEEETTSEQVETITENQMETITEDQMETITEDQIETIVANQMEEEQ